MRRVFRLVQNPFSSAQTLYGLDGIYLKNLWEHVQLAAGKYRVVRSPRGSWKFVARPTDDFGWTVYDLQHRIHGEWREIDAPKWCSQEVKAYGLDKGQRFSVRRVK